MLLHLFLEIIENPMPSAINYELFSSGKVSR